jgi:hypothetical protein
MKKTLFLTAALALSLSAGGAYAQPSQAQGGGATSPTSNPPAASDATRQGGTGMVGSGPSGNAGVSGSATTGSTTSTNTTPTNPAGPTGAGSANTSGATGTNNR